MPCAARGSDRCSRDHGPRHTRCAPEPRAAPRHAARGCRDRAQPHVLLPLSGVQPQGRRRPLDRRPARGPRRLRRSHAHRAAATRASFHRAALTRTVRPQPARPTTTSLPRAPCGRVHRVPPPRPASRAGRPRSVRSSTASLFASQSAAARALVDGASLGALCSPPVRSELPTLHLGVRQGCERSMQEAARVASAWAAEALTIARAAWVASAWVAWRDGRAGRTGSGREDFRARRRGGPR
jgi:hypothetical protein